jgi:hypothetical protein
MKYSYKVQYKRSSKQERYLRQRRIMNRNAKKKMRSFLKSELEQQIEDNITEHWLFMEFLREGDYPNNPYMAKVFHDFDIMKEYSGYRSSCINKKEFPYYSSTYVKFALF